MPLQGADERAAELQLVLCLVVVGGAVVGDRELGLGLIKAILTTPQNLLPKTVFIRPGGVIHTMLIFATI